MSEKTDKRTSRRLRYRRLRQPRNERRGVSPVVATLILILIAVAAAAALYLWLVGWQGSVTGSISKPGVNQGSFTMGGSTSVYPFSSLAVSWYEQNNTGVTISDTQGGSTAGALSVCSGGVDVGAVSAPFTPSYLIANDGCPTADASTITVTTIAYDAVDVIVSANNAHGLLSINYDTLTVVYNSATVVAGGTPSSAWGTPTIDGQAIGTGISGHGGVYTSLQWAQIPAVVYGASLSSVWKAGPTEISTGTPTEATDTVAALGTGGTLPTGDVACGVSSTTSAPTTFDDICDGTAPALVGGTGTASGTPCGFLVCAGGSGSGTTTNDYGAAISTVARSDGSGTTQAFEARLIDAASSGGVLTGWASQTTLNSVGTGGFTGCGNNNLISDCGFTSTLTGNGNPAVITAVAGADDSIGYASDGLARAAGSGVSLIAYTGVGQSASTDNGKAAWFGGVLPTTGSSGTIALGINAPTISNDYYTGYLGWRPFDLITLQPPSGIVDNFLNFVLQTGVNTELATVAQEVSVYSV